MSRTHHSNSHLVFHALLLAPILIPILGAGCSFDPSGLGPGANGDGGTLVDVITTDDGGNPLPCAQWTITPAHFHPCNIPAPGPPLALDMDSGQTPYRYDTNAGTLLDPQGAPVLHVGTPFVGDTAFHLISVESFEISDIARLRVTGGVPLLIASWGDITIDGEIDVSSKTGEVALGAGANSPLCADQQGTGGEGGDGGGGGGGGGGGFSGNGGLGGAGANDNATQGVFGRSADAPRELRGGCAGGKGGQRVERNDGGGLGGAGGGAIQLTADGTVIVRGIMHAGGQGGQPANPDSANNDESQHSGGGGGGSGGLIGIQADVIDIQSGAIVAANGAGGGAGTKNDPGQPGMDGIAGAAVAGGGEVGDAGNGGSGGYLNTASGQAGGPDNEGGGGGGGGVGYIQFDATNTPNVNPGAVFSPNWSALPPAVAPRDGAR